MAEGGVTVAEAVRERDTDLEREVDDSAVVVDPVLVRVIVEDGRADDDRVRLSDALEEAVEERDRVDVGVIDAAW